MAFNNYSNTHNTYVYINNISTGPNGTNVPAPSPFPTSKAKKARPNRRHREARKAYLEEAARASVSASSSARSTSAPVASDSTQGGASLAHENHPQAPQMSCPRPDMFPGNNCHPNRFYQAYNTQAFVPCNYRQTNRPAQRRDAFSDEMIKFQEEHRQKTEMYKRKFKLAGALERTLKQSFPDYGIRQQMVGSSTNRIGDNSPTVEICIMARKFTTPQNASYQVHSETVTTSSDIELHSPATAAAAQSTTEDDFVMVPAQSDDETVASIADESSSNETTNASQSYAAADKSGIDLAQIALVLENIKFGKDIQLASSKPPYLTFKDDVDHLDVTLYLNYDASIRTTYLINGYSKQDWRFQHLAMTIKTWARKNGILSDDTINDLSWSLMVLHYLQLSGISVLPSLQMIDQCRYNARRPVECLFPCAAFTRNWHTSNSSNLRELLTGFFNYYGNEFKFEKYIISVHEGKLLDRATHLASDKSNWNTLLCIEEPYSRANTIRALTDKAKLESIIGLFRAAFDTMTDPGTERTPRELALSDLITVTITD